jgi:hypothetical protein
MIISVFLAKVIGLYFILSSVALLIYKDRFKKLFKDVASTPFFINFTGFLGMIFGLLIVVSHNFWIDNWPTLITIIGWLILIQGFLRVYFPKCFADWNKKLVQSTVGLTWIGWIFLIIGVYLTYIGFSYSYYGF